jgi:hypothetical protein
MLFSIRLLVIVGELTTHHTSNRMITRDPTPSRAKNPRVPGPPQIPVALNHQDNEHVIGAVIPVSPLPGLILIFFFFPPLTRWAQ